MPIYNSNSLREHVSILYEFHIPWPSYMFHHFIFFTHQSIIIVRFVWVAFPSFPPLIWLTAAAMLQLYSATNESQHSYNILYWLHRNYNDTYYNIIQDSNYNNRRVNILVIHHEKWIPKRSLCYSMTVWLCVECAETTSSSCIIYVVVLYI